MIDKTIATARTVDDLPRKSEITAMRSIPGIYDYESQIMPDEHKRIMTAWENMTAHDMFTAGTADAIPQDITTALIVIQRTVHDVQQNVYARYRRRYIDYPQTINDAITHGALILIDAHRTRVSHRIARAAENGYTGDLTQYLTAPYRVAVQALDNIRAQIQQHRAAAHAADDRQAIREHLALGFAEDALRDICAWADPQYPLSVYFDDELRVLNECAPDMYNDMSAYLRYLQPREIRRDVSAENPPLIPQAAYCARTNVSQVMLIGKGNQKLMQKATRDVLARDGRVNFKLNGRNDKTTTVDMVVLTDTSPDTLQILRDLTGFEISVEQALINIIHACKREGIPWDIIPLSTIARVWKRNQKDNGTVTDAEKDLMWTALSTQGKLAMLYKRKNADGTTLFTEEGSYLYIRRIKATVNGAVTDCVQLFDLPIKYRIAERTHAIHVTPAEYISGGPRKKTQMHVVVRDFLHNRIIQMYRSRYTPNRRAQNKAVSTYIPIESVLTELGVENADRETIRKVRSAMREFLNAWSANGTGFIQSATDRVDGHNAPVWGKAKGKTVRGFYITLDRATGRKLCNAEDADDNISCELTGGRISVNG